MTCRRNPLWDFRELFCCCLFAAGEEPKHKGWTASFSGGGGDQGRLGAPSAGGLGDHLSWNSCSAQEAGGGVGGSGALPKVTLFSLLLDASPSPMPDLLVL